MSDKTDKRTDARLETIIRAEFGGWGMEEEAGAAVAELRRRLRAAKRELATANATIERLRLVIDNSHTPSKMDWLMQENERLTMERDEVAMMAADYAEVHGDSAPPQSWIDEAHRRLAAHDAAQKAMERTPLKREVGDFHPMEDKYGCSERDDCVQRRKAECEWCAAPSEEEA